MNGTNNDITIGTGLALAGGSLLATGLVDGWAACQSVGILLLICSGLAHAWMKASKDIRRLQHKPRTIRGQAGRR